jgi:hypothetical protein
MLVAVSSKLKLSAENFKELKELYIVHRFQKSHGSKKPQAWNYFGTASRPRPDKFEAKAAKFCPRGVLENEDSPRGPHPWCFLNY